MMAVAGWLYHEVTAAAPPTEVTAPTRKSTPAVVAGEDPPVAPPPTVEGARRSPPVGAGMLKNGLAAPRPAAPPTPPGRDDIGPPDPATPDKADPKWDAVLGQVNKSYDSGDYDEAKEAAIRLLKKDPNNVRMLRVVISSACQTGDPTDAQLYFERLTEKRDRDQMKTRCERNAVTLTDPK